MALLKSKEERAEAKQARERADAARRQRDDNPARRWEYRALYSRKGRIEGMIGAGSLQAKLNKWGAQGWELVTMTSERVVFKREILELSQAERDELADVEVPAASEEEEE